MASNGPGTELAALALNQEIQSVASDDIVSEWRRTTTRTSVLEYFERRNVPVLRLVTLVEDIIGASDLVRPVGEPPPCRDENDRKYLHCAVYGNVDFLVTTDLDLLVQQHIGSTRIIRPGALWHLLFE